MYIVRKASMQFITFQDRLNKIQPEHPTSKIRKSQKLNHNSELLKKMSNTWGAPRLLISPLVHAGQDGGEEGEPQEDTRHGRGSAIRLLSIDASGGLGS
jgi:hypothetical protein